MAKIPVKVKNGREGYFNKRYLKEGDCFQIEDEKQFSKIWMEKVKGKAANPVEPKKPAPTNATDADIVKAVELLDADNDKHWTESGMPDLDTIKGLVGDQDITRAKVTNAYPDFNRDKARG